MERFHAPGDGDAAEAHFDRVFVRHEVPEEIDEFEIEPGVDVHLPAAIAEAFGVSRSEARRMLTQGGVKLDGEVLPPEPLDYPSSELDDHVLQVGKRRFRRFKMAL